MVDVKICGLSEPETLEVSLANGADFVGFNFYPPSPRSVTPKRAATLARAVRGRARTVAVTVDADDELLAEIMDAIAPDYIQAHGQESPARVAAIVQRLGIPVIKAIGVRGPSDVAKADAYRNCAEMILFDAKAPDDKGDALPGGNGISFDWSLLAGRGGRRGFMLSGGLDASNVREAMARTGPAVVDVSSGVESAPGMKDSRLIANFIEAAKRGS